MEDTAVIQKYYLRHIMLAFLLLFLTMSWWKVANIIYKLILVLFGNNFIITANICVSIDATYI